MSYLLQLISNEIDVKIGNYPIFTIAQSQTFEGLGGSTILRKKMISSSTCVSLTYSIIL